MKTNTVLKYSIICIICAATMMSGCIDSAAKQTMFDGVYEVHPRGSYGFSIHATEEWTLYYEICSTEPLTVYIMTSSNYDRYTKGQQFDYIEKFPNVYEISDHRKMNGNSVVLITNDAWISSAKARVKIDAFKW